MPILTVAGIILAGTGTAILVVKVLVDLGVIR